MNLICALLIFFGLAIVAHEIKVKKINIEYIVHNKGE